MSNNYTCEFYTKKEFKDYLEDLNIERQVDWAIIHMTWIRKKPYSEWKGRESIEGYQRYYDKKGWSGRSPHLFIDKEGIWITNPLNDRGAYTGPRLDNAIHIEIVGYFENKLPDVETADNLFHALRMLFKKYKLSLDNISFHKNLHRTTCPGVINKNYLKRHL